MSILKDWWEGGTCEHCPHHMCNHTEGGCTVGPCPCPVRVKDWY